MGVKIVSTFLNSNLRVDSIKMKKKKEYIYILFPEIPFWGISSTEIKVLLQKDANVYCRNICSS